jgi:hypothetical protein
LKALRPDEAPLVLIAPFSRFPKQDIAVVFVLRLAITVNKCPHKCGRLDASTSAVNDLFELWFRYAINAIANAKSSMLIAIVTPKNRAGI